MGEVGAIFSLKLKQYYGPLRASPGALATAVLLYLLVMASAAGGALLLRISFGLPYQATWGWLENTFATAFSSLLAIGIYLGLKGGVTALQPEIDYVLTAPVKPDRYLVADLLFQVIFLNVSITPGLAAFTAVILYPSPPLRLLTALAAYELILFLAVMLSQVLGVAEAAGRGKSVGALGWAMIAFLTAPAIGFVFGLHFTYSVLPLPSTLAAKAVLSRISTPELIIFSAYVSAILIAYLRALKVNFFADVRPLLATAFMDTRPPAQAERLRGTISRIARLSRVIRLRPERGGLGLMLLKLHLIRVVRDGSLFTSLVFVGLFLAANLSLPSETPFAAAALITMMLLYVPFIPSLLMINWSISERPNLWIPASTPDGLKRYAASMLAACTVVAAAFSFSLLSALLLRLGEDPFLTLDLLLALSAPLFSSAIATISAFRLPPPRHAFSPSSLLHIVIPAAGTILLTTPILAARATEGFAENPSPIFTALYTAYTIIIYAVLASFSTRNLRGIELKD